VCAGATHIYEVPATWTLEFQVLECYEI